MHTLLAAADLASELNQYIAIGVGLITLATVIFGAGVTFSQLKQMKVTLSETRKDLKEHQGEDDRRFERNDSRLGALEIRMAHMPGGHGR